MKTKSILLFAIVMAIGMVSCTKNGVVRGNKDVITEERELDYFDKVANDGSFEVKIINDTIRSYVIIEAESNIIPHIDTYVSNGALIIDSDENLINRRDMKLYVHTAKIQAIELNGSGSMETDTFDSEEFSAVVDGSGDINCRIRQNNQVYVRVSGSGNLSVDIETNYLEAVNQGSGELRIQGVGQVSDLNVEGSGSIRAYDFLHQRSASRSDGSGSIYLYVTDYLNAKIYGSGSIYYAGNTAAVEKEDNGSGSIIKR